MSWRRYRVLDGSFGIGGRGLGGNRSFDNTPDVAAQVGDAKTRAAATTATRIIDASSSAIVSSVTRPFCTFPSRPGTY